MPLLEVFERTTERTFEIPLVVSSPADPFEIDHDCIDPKGHQFIADCSEVVCITCGRIACQ